MIKIILRCFTCFLIMAGLAFSCTNGNTKESKISETSVSIRIPAMKGLLSQGEDISKLKRMTNTERKEMGMDAMDKYEIKSYRNQQLAKGKEIFKNEKGRLATFLVIQEDYIIIEFLASYDTNGQVIDYIPIAQKFEYRSDEENSTIEGNTITIRCSWGEMDEWGEGVCQVFTITDDLHFTPFIWPSPYYPCNVPFMTYETSGDYGENGSDATIFYQIESITCTGVSGKQYQFVIKSASKQDCKKLKTAERTLMFEPLDSENEVLSEAIKVVMSAIGENEMFEVKMKGLNTGKVDEARLRQFKVKR